jgi:hypothetical protein
MSALTLTTLTRYRLLSVESRFQGRSLAFGYVKYACVTAHNFFSNIPFSIIRKSFLEKGFRLYLQCKLKTDFAVDLREFPAFVRV